jgi:hypothetical protein
MWIIDKKIAKEAGIGFSLPTSRQHENVPGRVSGPRPEGLRFGTSLSKGVFLGVELREYAAKI